MKLENKLREIINQLLSGPATSAEGVISSSSEICVVLERYIPRLLAEHYVEWQYESLDGIFPSVVGIKGRSGFRLAGTCILLSDQTVTPFDILICQGSEALNVLLHMGEAGGGTMGISGPSCHSRQAEQLFHRLPNRLAKNSVEWVYRISQV